MDSVRRLSDAESALVQTYLGWCINEVLQLGLTPQIEYDFEAFKRLRAGVANNFVYPCYDPARSDFTPETAFWVRAVDARGQTVATSAMRLFGAADFYDTLRDETLWFRERAAAPRVNLLPDLPPIGGMVGHAGGTFVTKDWRGVRLSGLLPWMARAIALRTWHIDHETALVFDDLAHSRVPREEYHYARVFPVLEGFFPPTGKNERVWFCHLSRTEALAAMRATVTAPDSPDAFVQAAREKAIRLKAQRAA